MKYPIYELVVEGKSEWCSLYRAGVLYDSGWMKVELGTWVQDSADVPPRRMNNDDRARIRDAADECSANK